MAITFFMLFIYYKQWQTGWLETILCAIMWLHAVYVTGAPKLKLIFSNP